MSQDYIDNVYDGTFVVDTTMANVEKNFAALKSAFSGPASPPNPIAGMWWYDTTANILKIRNETNNAWQNVWNFASNKPVIANLSNEITGAMINAAAKDPVASTPGLRTLGTGAQQACAGNDSRLSLGRVQVFTSSGTFVAESTKIMVLLAAGGGGGGGGTSTAGGGGGGAGGYINKQYTVAINSSYNITIGGGGAGGGISLNGSNGGSSSFPGVVVSGGYGGVSLDGIGGSGGVINVFPGASGGRGSNKVGFIGGTGGFSNGDFGRGGGGAAKHSNGGVGIGYAAGGGGGGGSIPTGSGGAGAPGYCLITW